MYANMYTYKILWPIHFTVCKYDVNTKPEAYKILHYHHRSALQPQVTYRKFGEI